jgi:uncharacterized membrane protein YidH (DUF202 family)
MRMRELDKLRTILANERTLLAYVRTALALLIFGMAAIKFFPGTFIIVILGWFFMVCGIVLLVYAATLTALGMLIKFYGNVPPKVVTTSSE